MASRVSRALLRDTKRTALAIVLIIIVVGSSFGVLYFLPRGPGPAGGDNDGMPDSWERLYGLDMNDPSDALMDKDGDTLTNLQEYLLGTNPTLTDSDSDNLRDDDEVDLGTDPNDADSDDDTLTDAEEVLTYFTDPLNPDSDMDLLSDAIEVNIVGSDPNAVDTDQDSLTDSEEFEKLGTNPLSNDTDSDSLWDADELRIYGTDPKSNDTDSDLLFDNEELQYGTDPLDSDSDDDGVYDGSEPDWNVDSDGDSLINALDPDSDNDLMIDGDELLLGADPLNNDSDSDNVIDGWDPAPVDSDADDDGIQDGDEATTWAYWYEAEELDLEQGLVGNDPDARNAQAVYSTGPGIMFNSSVPSSQADYKFFVRARAEFPGAANRSMELSIEYNGTVVVGGDLHLLTAIYRWYSTPFFNMSAGSLQIVVNASHAWVVVDRVALIRMDSINSELTDPLDQDTDGDNVIEGRESVLNSYWYEAEDFAWSPTQVIDNTTASNSKHISPLLDGRLAFISDPSYIFPNGTYVVFVRAMSAILNSSNIVEVDVNLGGDPITVPPVQFTPVRQVVYNAIPRDVNLYEWFFVLQFVLPQDNSIDIALTAMGSLNDIFVDKVLLMKLDYWSDTAFVSYDNGTGVVASVLNVPRGISDPMAIDTDEDGYRAADGFLADSTGWFTDGFELYDIGSNPFDIDSDRDGDADTVDPNPISGDTDGDGIFDYIELLSSYNGTPTDPLNADTDGDFIRDGDEDLNLDGALTTGETNPTVADTDMDGIPDGIETGITDPNAIPEGPSVITDPLNPDSDGDSILDGIEDANANGVYEPALNETRADEPDTDFDALDDNIEPNYSTDPNNPDSDFDWVTDGLEILRFGTNATRADTDGEGLRDGAEIFRYHTNPLLQDTDFDSLTDLEEVVTYRTNPLLNDTDQEGLYDNQEVMTYGTDPKNPDTDEDGDYDYAEVQAGTNPLNAPPEAHFRLNGNVYRNIAAKFDATKSYDSDGSIVSYSWAFGDGSVGSTVKPTHAFAQTGEFDVSLTVTDDDGESGTTTFTVTVLNQLPVADAGSDQTVFAGYSVDFHATPGSTDPDGSIVSYDWNFMDGSTSTGESTTHVFAVAGTYYVTLTVTDNDGGRDTDTVVITAEQPKPPDLKVPSGSLTFSSDGDNVVLGLTIQNDGDIDSGSFFFQVHDEDSGWNSLEQQSPSIDARSSQDFNVALPAEPIGLHDMTILLDIHHQVDESDEGNNFIRFSIPDDDGDGLSNQGEIIAGTDPNDSDSDSDSLYDGPMIDPSRTEPDWNIDSDGDGMINALDTDSENDGTPDGVDLDPLHDLLVKVKITRLEVEDPIDFDIVTMSRTVRVPYLSCSWSGCRIKYRSFTIYYPAPVFDRRAEPYFRVSIADQWNSGHWLHSEVPVASDTEVYSPGNPPVFVANVPDDQPQVPVSIQAWDMDIGPDDLLDLADGTGQTFYLTFDLETAASHPLGGYGIAGSTSGSADGSYGADEDDARILFSISLDYELSYQEQVALAQKFRPQLYFDQDETWRPRDIQEYLSHSTLETSTGALVDATPTPAEIAGLSDLYLNLDDTYHSQDSSTYGLKIYSHVFTTYRNRIVVQYWFCYLYNDGINNHEGDWEMIQVVLPAKGSADVDDLIPLAAGYSWHYYIQRKVWSSPLLLKAGDTHPVVFIEKGGHGSQFVPLTGTYDGEDMSQYSIGIISNQDWLLFRGYWGEKGSFEFTTGPPGPVFRSTDNLELSYLGENYDAYMWTDPIFWINYVLELVDVL